jgi:hypothetical protein
VKDINIKFHSLRDYKARNEQLHALANFNLVYKLGEAQLLQTRNETEHSDVSDGI